MSAAIKGALFALETVAHLQGREGLLLPIAEAARAELEELVAALVEVNNLLNDPDADEYVGVPAIQARIASVLARVRS